MRELRETWCNVLLELVLILMTGVFILKRNAIDDMETFWVLYVIVALNVIIFRILGRKQRIEAYTEEE